MGATKHQLQLQVPQNMTKRHRNLSYDISLERPKLIGQTPHMSIFIRSHDVMFKYPIPWIFLSPETDDYLREIQEEEEDRLREFLTEEEIDEQFDDEAYHNLDT
ncbi:hypothetical protein LWI29_023634 [Acer saccharum]|uniref:Uncharacterized protein n=1 Tax=Acer saccharum TaxID=4024 RepID=A0AA39TPI8_ACESA|nr:hypothetical protein LWI29_023634 [Acer saccharum]